MKITAVVQCYNKYGYIYLNACKDFGDSYNSACIWVENMTWPNVTGVHFINDGYFEKLYNDKYVEFLDGADNKFVARLIEKEE